MTTNIYKQGKPLSYKELHQLYLNLQDEVFSNIADKFKQTTKSPEIERLYVSSNNFIQSLDRLHDHYNSNYNKSAAAAYIDKELNNILKTSISEMQKLNETVGELNPNIKMSFSQFKVAKILLDGHASQCEELMENLIDAAANHVAKLQLSKMLAGEPRRR
jgi:hypothetical protein